ncbi:PhzF family phenazine biosynthesis protein [Iamia sp. SCSIO 61187]|uniref:PhzF family phenazine biosynthesis protein n=1 Tax=Iamia sp. SCSIO 61187 TaxID=2722752 RepID=UPI001C62824D|nr:PhzF family phenazine biosynthesis protein [Iamia sp. SCSIO 61187]QYG91435.1 PhzF family phenazine biosynthesis protein [Iamia sp. SCSIO 61187]
MTRARPFRQVDVFTAEPTRGNPVAVVLDADDLSEAEMAAFARWTNLSETAFVLTPTVPAADYRVRIFTPGSELPFAGHPTLGTAHAWLDAGGTAATPGRVVQECGIGLVGLRQDGDRLAFAAPPVKPSAVAAELRDAATAALGVDPAAVRDARLLVNGPAWLTLRLDSAATVSALEPDMVALAALEGVSEVGVVGAHPEGHEVAVEVRGFAPALGVPEDPVTGSLNASIALWLQGEGILPDAYVAAQGTALGRTGRVHVVREGDTTWVGGDTVTVLAGTAAQ